MSKKLLVIATVLVGAALTACSERGPDVAPSEPAHGSRYHLPDEYAEWEADYQQRIDALVASYASRGVVEPPADATFVRFVQPDENARVISDCMARQGFTSTVGWDDSVIYDSVPSEQLPAMSMAEIRCAIMYPVHPRYTQPQTETQIRITYDYWIQTLSPCLSREGYPVDMSMVPTWETFLASWETGPWSPYDTVIAAQKELAAANGGVEPSSWAAEWRRLNETCPQNPSFEELYPETS